MHTLSQIVLSFFIVLIASKNLVNSEPFQFPEKEDGKYSKILIAPYKIKIAIVIECRFPLNELYLRQ